tara:strand:- start:9659 stop:10288 length:630 start_codon:yes stop_codon:yes gene_type:complete
MWGKIENKKITKIYKYPEIIRDANGTQYPKSIFQNSKRLEDFYIYSVINKNTMPVHAELYNGISESYVWNDKDKKIERTYNAVAKNLDDTNAKDEDGKDLKDKDGKQIINFGLKTTLKNKVREIQSSLLSNTDKWIIRKADTDDAIPTTVGTYRKGIRDSATAMETAITNAKTFDAIVSLLTPETNKDGTIKTPATLYNFPEEPDGMPS